MRHLACQAQQADPGQADRHLTPPLASTLVPDLMYLGLHSCCTVMLGPDKSLMHHMASVSV